MNAIQQDLIEVREMFKGRDDQAVIANDRAERQNKGRRSFENHRLALRFEILGQTRRLLRTAPGGNGTMVFE